MRLDVHQHIWTGPLIESLSARRIPPLIRRHNGVVMLHSAGEQPYMIDVAAEAAQQRASLVRDDGLDLALIAISSPIGIEALQRESALELIDAHLRGVGALPGEFAAWGPFALDRADARDVDDLLARGCVGVSIPAGALAGPDRLHRMGAILERVALRGVPLFVHPGAAPRQWRPQPVFGEPLWWGALTEYVAQMQAAWLTFASFGRREHPNLDVIFAMLAGGAPLLNERLRARGGPPIELRDPRVFYDTSSYGPAAIGMMATHVGRGQLLYGSDRPLVEPDLSGLQASLPTQGMPLFASRAVAA